MRFPTAILTLFLGLVIVNASNPRAHNLAARHSRISARTPVLEAKAPQKRCSGRNGKKAPAASTGSTLAKAAPPQTTTTTKSTTNYQSGGGSSGNVINAPSGKCGPSGAVAKTTKTAGPNGSINYLNCGVNGAGWTPPSLQMQDLVVVPLADAVKSPNSPFKPCAPYIPIFQKYGQAYGIQDIFLASFAMQESSCNPATIGGAGEQGLMQITKEKCTGAPGGNCLDPDFNIHTGAKYFSQTLAGNNGDVLKSLGQYNGWYPGLTVAKATAAADTSCCRCQNNLDYLHQFLNGWCQNINAYDQGLGEYFNLNKCN